MFGLPPLPSWDGLHPLIIHFPIGLLFVAPLFVVIGAILKPQKSRPMFVAALLLMVLGTVAAVIAMESGEATAKLADRTPQINAVISAHEDLAERTVITFTALDLLFLAIVVLPQLMKRVPARLLTTALPLLFLAAYAFGVLTLTNTAHNGGRLVHEFGVHASVAGAGNASQAAVPTGMGGESGDRD